MDFNDEMERLLRSMDQRQEEFNKESLAVFKEFAKEIKKMSAEQRKGIADQVKETKSGRLRDEARAKRTSTNPKDSGDTRADEARKAATKNLTESFKGTSRNLGNFSSNLVTATDNLNDLSGLLKTLPLIGGLLGGAFVGLVINGIQTTVESFRTLNKTGVIFGDSILDINMAAVRAGMGLSEFSDMVSKNASMVNRFGMSNIMDVNGALNDTGSEMRKMGLTTKEITAHLFDYLEYQRLAGITSLNDTMKEQQQASKLARIIDDLALATGESIETIRGKMLETLDNSRFKILVSGLGEEQGAALSAFTGVMKGYIPELENILADLSVGGSTLTNNLPYEVQGILSTLLQDMDTGKAEAALKQWADGVSRDQTDIWQSGIRSGDERSRIAADLWSNLTKLNDVALLDTTDRETARSEMSLLNDSIQQLREAAILPLLNAIEKLDPVKIEALSDNLDKLATSLGGLLATSLSDTNIARFNKFIEDVSNGDFSSMQTGLTVFTQGLITAAFGPGTLEKLQESITTITGAINSVATFWTDHFGSKEGIIGTALAIAFGPSLLAAMMKAVGRMAVGGMAMDAAGGVLGGGKPGKGGSGSMIGKIIGSSFMRQVSVAGIGVNLASMAIDGINGEIDSGTIGTGAGTLVGGFAGAFFGNPLLGAAIGGWLGGAIGDMFTEQKSEAMRQLEGQLQEAMNAEFAASTVEELTAAKATTATVQDAIETQKQADVLEDSTKATMLGVWSNPLFREELFKGSSLDTDTQGSLMELIGSRMTGDMSLEQAKQIQTYLQQIEASGSAAAASVLSSISPSLDKFATGGIATKASIFGEAGAEAAIPLDNGMRIPIAEVDIKGMEEIQRTSAAQSQMNSQLIEVMTGVKQSLDKFINYSMSSNKTKEQIEVLLGIYEKLDSIDGSNDGILRNSRASI